MYTKLDSKHYTFDLLSKVQIIILYLIKKVTLTKKWWNILKGGSTKAHLGITAAKYIQL